MTNKDGLRAYSKAEYLSDAAVHITGIGAALIGGPILVALAAVWTRDANLTLAFGIYALALLGMLVCSALYNMIHLPQWADRLRRLDQSAIYIKIAGTYTPFIALSAGHTGMLALIWGGAVAGASIIILSLRKRLALAIALYLGLGWACVVWGWPMLAALTGAGFWLLVAAGVLYSVGVVFLLWSRLPFHNTIWHVFVLAATGLCYAAIAVELAAAAAA